MGDVQHQVMRHVAPMSLYVNQARVIPRGPDSTLCLRLWLPGTTEISLDLDFSERKPRYRVSG
jgi:hypothetical protein